MSKKYLLPGEPWGSDGVSKEEYIQGWLDLAQPIMDVTGADLFALDPTVRLRKPDPTASDRHDYATLPVWFLKAFNRWYNKQGYDNAKPV